jgi:hypothetical protein
LNCIINRNPGLDATHPAKPEGEIETPMEKMQRI